MKPSITVVKGKKVTIETEVLPSNAGSKKLLWQSDNPQIAAVDENGAVKGIKGGNAMITATAQDGSGKSNSCKVTVAEMKLNAGSFPLQAGKTTTALKVEKKYPANDKVSSWSSSNKKVLTVDKKGKIKGIKTGKATITVKMKSGAQAACKVTVQRPKVTTKSLTAKTAKITLNKGKKSTLKVIRKPISATEKITFTTSAKKIAAVDKKGVITAKGQGTATITAKSSNGKKMVCKVTVPGLTLKKTAAVLKVNDTASIQIKAQVPAQDKVTYTSANPAVAAVDANGKVTAEKPGKTTITVQTKSGAKAVFKVTVKERT